MVIFFVVLLGISIAGLVSLLSVKHYELTRERVILPSMRPAAAHYMARAEVLARQHIPALARAHAQAWWEQALAWAHRAVASVVVELERTLERALQRLRYKTHPKQGGEASPFLREVAEHKKKLLRYPRNRSIFEE
ncbi:MAG: hypothetical protein KGI70_01205 [Patescibacteria group bacterium]|nr:hypothetical protein [Patescibacteria group bacterium]